MNAQHTAPQEELIHINMQGLRGAPQEVHSWQSIPQLANDGHNDSRKPWANPKRMVQGLQGGGIFTKLDRSAQIGVPQELQ